MTSTSNFPVDFKFPQSDTVIIVAPGPSLSSEQIRLISNSVDLIITIGDAGRVALPYSDILYHADKKWWNYYNGCPEFKGGLKISFDPTEFKDVYNLERTENNQGLASEFPKCVTGNNSGYQAINLATYANPKKIILVGFDMQDTGGKHNIIGDHPREVKRQTNFELFKANIATLTKPLELLEIDVYNCSINTALNCFKKAELADVI